MTRNILYLTALVFSNQEEKKMHSVTKLVLFVIARCSGIMQQTEDCGRGGQDQPTG